MGNIDAYRHVLMTSKKILQSGKLLFLDKIFDLGDDSFD